MKENQEQTREFKKPNYISGIVRIKPSPPKTDEEIERRLQEIHDAQFDPNVMHVGRRGNIVIPMDSEWLVSINLKSSEMYFSWRFF